MLKELQFFSPVQYVTTTKGKRRSVSHFILTSLELLLLILQFIKNEQNFYFIYAVLFLFLNPTGFKCGANLKPKTICITSCVNYLFNVTKQASIVVLPAFDQPIDQLEQRERKSVQPAHDHTSICQCLSVCLSVLLYVRLLRSLPPSARTLSSPTV